MSISKNHPYWTILKLIEENADASKLTFSNYKYIPQSISDKRDIFQVTRDDFLREDYVENMINSCPMDQELAIHSTIEMDYGEEKHLPMVDMSTSSKAQLLKIRPFIGTDLFDTFSWFFSGRSFHGYGGCLLKTSDWTKLMGAFLLSNIKDMKPTVDPRWIGHRLLAGYSALRWTKQTDSYLTLPEIIKITHL